MIARGNVVPMMTETESEEIVQYVSDEDAAREDRLVSEIRMITEQTKQVVLGFCGRYRFVGERVLCDPAAGRDRVLDLDESERFELVSISIESRLADTELPDNLTGRGWCAIIE